jgi:chemotaxis protein methyltransferase CheR
MMLQQIRQSITKKMGWSLDRFSDQELEEKLLKAGAELGFNHFGDFAKHLLQTNLSDTEIQAIALYFTVGESFFFRYRSDFEVLISQVIPQSLKEKPRNTPIQIWCAGCSSGEEPYTMAIYLANHFAYLPENRIKIFATDINPFALRKARLAKYTNWSLRDTTMKEKLRFFNPVAQNNWQLDQGIMAKVNFSYQNLADDNYYVSQATIQKFDIIFCRNVLIYFTEANLQRVLRQLKSMLTPDGALILSPCESSLAPNTLFEHHITNATTLLRPMNGKVKTSNLRSKTRLLKTDPLRKRKTVLLGLAHESKPPTPEKPQTYDYRQQARDLYQQGAYESAAGVMLLMARSDMTTLNESDFVFLVQTLVNAGRPKEALEWCEKGLTASKMNHSLRQLKASILQERGQTEAARQTYEEILFLNQIYTGALFMLGCLEQQLGNVEAGRNFLLQAERTLSGQQENEPAVGMDGISVKEAKNIIKGMHHG